MGVDDTISVDSALTISFGDVEIDVDNFELRRAGESVSVEPQVFDVLCYLIEHRDRVVSKNELLDNIWGDQFVGESALTSRIKSARRAVGDDGRRQEIIRTTHGRGYRFVAEVLQAKGTDATDPAGEGASTEPSEANAPRSNVPAPIRPLVARDRELATLIRLLQSNRLVTLSGPGGVGKTRLVTEVARHWDYDSHGAVRFVALARISDPAEVIGAIRDALGIKADDAIDTFAAVAEELAGASTLLVLDNFEHVVEAATTVGELVRTVPELRLLITSRERLGLAGEQVLELEPFALATDDPSADAAAAPAVTFFEHAVTGVGSELQLDANNQADIVAICRMLDGLPLAIELAAAQTRYFSLSYLRTHLESRAISVADHARDRPERHQTMAATIAWSYGLLTPSQQALLASLSVYKSGWRLEVADAMVEGGQPGAGTRELLALVDKSLVQRTTGAFGEPRFSMLHLLREFAGDKLEASGRTEETLHQHAESVGEMMRSLEAHRWSDPGDRWVEAINAEYPEAVAALTWCFNDGDPEVGCQIAAALGFWWYRSGRHGEGRLWMDRALAHSATIDDATAAWIHAAAGNLAAYELRPEECLQQFEVALNLARKVGDERLEALSLCSLGGATLGVPAQYETGLEAVKLGLEKARRLKTPQLIAHGLIVLGELTRSNGHHDAAEAAYREALALNVQNGNRYYEAINVLNIGHALTAQDRVAEARSYYQRGSELAAELGSRLIMGWSLSALATPRHLNGQPQLAARLAGAAQETLDTLGATYGPVDHPLHLARQNALRAELGDDEYARLVAEGSEMTLAEAMEIVRQQLDSTDEAPG